MRTFARNLVSQRCRQLLAVVREKLRIVRATRDRDVGHAAVEQIPGRQFCIHVDQYALVMAHTGAGGFVHASIPLAAKAVEALGNQGGLWTTTVSYDAADINTNNLKKFDAIFLDSTTACFLDDPDPSVTAARRAAFLNFVRGGKEIGRAHV